MDASTEFATAFEDEFASELVGDSSPSVAGRICPASYSYSPSEFARPADVIGDVLYVIGGLYGNRPALAEIERMALCEETRPQLVFNGDFHWFDAAADSFAWIDRA